MIKKVNPRVGMFEALQLTADLCQKDNHATLRVFLDRNYSGTIDVLYPKVQNEQTIAVAFRFNQQGFIVPAGHILVKERKSGEIRMHTAADFANLFSEYPSNAETELKKLADYIQKVAPETIQEGDSAADAAIRIIHFIQNVASK